LRDSLTEGLFPYSLKVFIPLTNLPRRSVTTALRASVRGAGNLSPLTRTGLAIAHAGAAAGCHRGAVQLGDKPELRYQAARGPLKKRSGTNDDLLSDCDVARSAARAGLLPACQSRVMTREEIAGLREVRPQGIMLESTSDVSAGRWRFTTVLPTNILHQAGDPASGRELKVPFTTGILIGIVETRNERIDALGDSVSARRPCLSRNHRPEPSAKPDTSSPIPRTQISTTCCGPSRRRRLIFRARHEYPGAAKSSPLSYQS